jgi:hypothetical protein
MTKNELKAILERQNTPGEMLRVILSTVRTDQKLGPFTKATFIRGLLMAVDMLNHSK